MDNTFEKPKSKIEWEKVIALLETGSNQEIVSAFLTINDAILILKFEESLEDLDLIKICELVFMGDTLISDEAGFLLVNSVLEMVSLEDRIHIADAISNRLPHFSGIKMTLEHILSHSLVELVQIAKIPQNDQEIVEFTTQFLASNRFDLYLSAYPIIKDI